MISYDLCYNKISDWSIIEHVVNKLLIVVLFVIISFSISFKTFSRKIGH